MSETLILSKLQKPDLTNTFIRKQSLFEGLSSSIISLVCAPAGTGKSSLMSDCLDHLTINYLWYSLDDWDNDISVFLSYLQKGLEGVDENVANKFQELTQAYLSLSQAGLNKSIIGLLQEIKKPWVLVLDDYHHISESSIHDFINDLLIHLPLNLSLCIMSREDPPLHLAKLRSQGKLYEIRMSSLKFTSKETETFFNIVMDRKLNKTQIDYLYERSEGWIAGLQLISMTLHEVDGVDEFIKTFSENQEYIMDYLLEEVLHRHSENSREFLLKTSVFTYFSEDLCAFVLEIPTETVAFEINHLFKTNGFLTSIKKEKQWYRYHHLFRTLLIQQVRTYKNIDINHLYKRAGIWYEKKEAYQESISNYIKGGHFEEAQRLIEIRFTVMDMALHSASWLELAKRLPLEYIKKSPVICIGYGWALLDQGKIQACEEWFKAGDELFKALQLNQNSQGIKVHDRNTFENIPILLLSSKAYIAAIKRDYDALLLYTEALKEGAKDSRYTRQWVIESFVGMMYWGQGKLEKALEIMVNLKEDPLNDLQEPVRNTFTWIIAELYIQQGQLTRAKLMLEDAIEEILDNNVLSFLVATYYMLLAWIESIRGHRDQAYQLLETSKAYGFRYEFMDWRYKYHLLKSRLYIQDGLFDQAKISIQEGKQNRFLNPAPEAYTLEDLSFCLVMIKDHDDQKKEFLIEEALHELEGSSVDLPPYRDEMRWKIILSKSKVESYGQRLLPICKNLLQRAKFQKRHIDIIEYTLLLRRFVVDESDKAHLLNTAKLYSKKEGILQPFIEFDQDYIRLENKNTMSLEVKVAQVNENLIEPLTGRELDVLGLIAKGFSNQEISNHLFITLSTVKSYNNRLFSKLEVKRRTEAVAKAKEMGLLL